MPSVLLVGERCNTRYWRPRLVADDDLRVRARVGAFRTLASRSRLVACGLRWDAAMNLLWPEGQPPGPWDERLARRVASLMLRESHDVYLLAGRRVARAFGLVDVTIPSLWRVQGKSLLVVPHPSGLNRLWNDPLVRARVQELWEEVTRVDTCVV